MKEEKYIITYIQDGEEKTIERIETEEEMHERIKCYKRNNIKIKMVVKEVVTVSYVEVKW
jgi:hypothetical protein